MCNFLYTSVLLNSSEMIQKDLSSSFFFLLERIPKLRALSSNRDGGFPYLKYSLSQEPGFENSTSNAELGNQESSSHVAFTHVQGVQTVSQELPVICSTTGRNLEQRMKGQQKSHRRLWTITTKPVKISQAPVDADEIQWDCSAEAPLKREPHPTKPQK